MVFNSSFRPIGRVGETYKTLFTDEGALQLCSSTPLPTPAVVELTARFITATSVSFEGTSSGMVEPSSDVGESVLGAHHNNSHLRDLYRANKQSPENELRILDMVSAVCGNSGPYKSTLAATVSSFRALALTYICNRDNVVHPKRRTFPLPHDEKFRLHNHNNDIQPEDVGFFHRMRGEEDGAIRRDLAQTTHLTAPTVPGGNPEYHMRQLKAYALTSDKDTFVRGATRYRDNRDLAMTYRDGFIEQANDRARKMPISSSTTTFSDSRTSLSPLIVGEDTSQDEMARNEVTPVKRLRPDPMPPDSHEATTGQSSRTTSPLTPQRSAAADLTPLDDTVTGRGTCPSNNQVQTLQNAIEVPSKRMRHEGALGWCIKHESTATSSSIFTILLCHLSPIFKTQEQQSGGILQARKYVQMTSPACFMRRKLPWQSLKAKRHSTYLLILKMK
ncbi:uncharacterized protein A1O9_04007 [Exophiala aquamarina CBS 119918]|uniref:Uncharacterized protein n=1 Tax=Exophiala aquamarina CBS 119918 TaxID=1182545 RepID=A0A072PIL8_9EURO|nr:uncharacterized protein A1O9_04007 [Exophiala aquamarina CBS 119918]KEF59163.1 hypothetical protein A1O9_04007 [Exophiala aquamarina CBS 119918]